MKICKQTTLGFNDTLLMLIGVPTISLIVPLLLMEFSELSLNHYLFNAYVSSIHVVVLWFAFKLIFIHARTQYPNFNEVVKRLIYQMSLIVISYIILDSILDFLCVNVFFDEQYLEKDRLSVTTGSLIMIALVCSVYEGIYLYKQLKKSIQEKEQLQRENIQSQLEGLRSQVNPHFLFNSLNTLSYLIPEDSDRAVNFVQQLSKVYRYILEIREANLIPLREELEFLQAYIFLLKERFEENIQININISPNQLQRQIVPLSLQILLENAIKHNVISTKKPLLIEIYVDELGKLIVRNNLQQKTQTKNSTKVGLQNIKNRYCFLSNEAVVISTATSFIVSLPLIENKQLI